MVSGGFKLTNEILLDAKEEFIYIIVNGANRHEVSQLRSLPQRLEGFVTTKAA
jgi:hypothetical protein